MKAGRRSGFTLIEMLMSLVILTVILGSAALAASAGQSSFRQSVHDSQLNARTNRALNRIVRLVTAARFSTLFPQPVAPFASDNISFQAVLGWDGAAALLSTDTGLLFEYEPGEVDNGLDDDGDGLIDECQVVQVTNQDAAEELRTVLISGVPEFLEGEEPDGDDTNGNGLEDESGLCFELLGSTLIIRLSAMSRQPDGNIQTKTLETAVGIRN